LSKAAVYQASAPGSLVLMGEHAVLHNHRAMAVAINKRLSVLLRPRPDKKIIIQSHLGDFETRLTEFKVQAPFQFVLETISRYLPQIPTGFELSIESEFSDTLGFGSSAAVVVATLGVLEQWLGGEPPSLFPLPFTRESPSLSPLPFTGEGGRRPGEGSGEGINPLFVTAKSIVQTVQQGKASGIDIAASLVGGLILYRQDPFLLEKIEASFPLVAVYSGQKRKTSEVIQHVENLRLQQIALYDKIFSLMDKGVEEAFNCFKKDPNHSDWSRLGSLLNLQHGLMSALGVSNTALEEIVYALRQNDAIYGAKISGAGLGDCVIGLAKTDFTSTPIHWPHPQYPIFSLEIAKEGLEYE